MPRKKAENKSEEIELTEPKELPEKELVKAAENESIKTEELEKKKKAILEKVEKLKEKIEETKTEDLKEQIKTKKKTDTLIPLEEYVKSGIYLGTRVVTPDMKQYVYRRRADGLAIFNTDIIDEKIKESGIYLSGFNPDDVSVVCKRQAGWKAARLFSEITGIRAFTKKYPAGILTNTNLPDFFESELTIVTDHWLDKNAMSDTLRVNKKVLMICDTNNFSKDADQIIIGNNKSAKSIGLIFYLLTREYCKAKKIKKEVPALEYWTGEKE
jgi:small subunit ribosomal protein S2